MSEELPHVLNALDIMVDNLGMSGRIALDLPPEYDWERVNELLGHMTIAELEIFCLGTSEDKDALKREFQNAEEADYAHEAIEKLFEALKRKQEKQFKKDNGP